jgi:hypothetical protein
MEWIPEAITLGEIDALKITASEAWADDTRYPRWRGASYGGGQCYVTAVWLTNRLGGFVGKKAGHYAWLSPDQSYILDLTGNHTGFPDYAPNDGYDKYQIVHNARTETFIKRANSIFNNLEIAIKISNDSLTGDAFPAEEPQRQNDNDSQYWHDEPSPQETEFPDKIEKYNFFYANGSMEISPEDKFTHDDLAHHLNIPNDHRGPMASGTVEVVDNKATWNAHSNIDLKTLSRVFKDYSNQVGWEWDNVQDIDGKVVSKSLQSISKIEKINYVWSNNHLYMGKTSHAILAPKKSEDLLCGTIIIAGNKAKVDPAYKQVLPQLFEWADDQGFKLYASSNNLVKRYEDMEQENLGKPDGGDFNPVEGDAEDDTAVPDIVEESILRCPICDKIFPDQHLYQKHRKDEHGGDVEIEEHGKFPELNMDLTNPPKFTEQQPTTMPVYGMIEATRVDGFERYAKAFKYDKNDDFYVSYLHGSPIGCAVIGEKQELKMLYTAVRRKGVASKILDVIENHHPFLYTHLAHEWEPKTMRNRGWVKVNKNRWVFAAGKEPKDTIEAAIPFVYDIPADTITVGHPGQRTSDIPGKFTPAGIVEGMYEPGGTVNITTMTTMPYTVNHILTLWYYQYPEFSVNKVNLVDAEGKKTKLANESL